MSQFNTSTNHPLIPNSQEYFVYKKYISIHSEDRDTCKYPNAAQFEIELPQDYLNVRSVKLSSWTFPANYNTFSIENDNITMSFRFNKIYNPGTIPLPPSYLDAIFSALYKNIENNYNITIEEGFYNPQQMVRELTNRFNQAVTNYLLINIDPNYKQDFLNNGGYQQFVVVYNEVTQKIWFGNRSSGFELSNCNYNLEELQMIHCFRPRNPDASNTGLPGYLGLPKHYVTSVKFPDLSNPALCEPRFYYGDVTPGDNGYWLTPDPDYPGANVYYFECPFKINLMGNSHFYMEVDLFNNLDETCPFNVSQFTKTTNKTNGIVNSAFAKIPVTTTPMAQWFDDDCESYKLFDPPAERIRRMAVKFRYHNGLLVDFGDFPYSFTLEFTLFSARKLLGYKLTEI
jgi:hypothetical protein